MPKKYTVCIKTAIDLCDAEKLVNYVDQGWKLHGLDETKSLMVYATKEFEVETDCIELYAKAIEAILDIIMFWYEETEV